MTDNRFIKELVQRYPALFSESENIYRVYSTLKFCFFNQKKFFVCGNGGSGADSEHIVGELMKGFCNPRPLSGDWMKRFDTVPGKKFPAGKLQMGLPCISLLSHPALTTAFNNDVDPSLVYAQQLFVLGGKGDCVMGISTSGNAENVYRAFQTAKAKEITTILLTGNKHGICEELSDYKICVPESETYKVQEYHLPIYHCLCLMLEEEFYGNR